MGRREMIVRLLSTHTRMAEKPARVGLELLISLLLARAQYWAFLGRTGLLREWLCIISTWC